MTERQADQKWVEDTRAEYLRRANHPAMVLDWGRDKPRPATPAELAGIRKVFP